MWKAGCLCSVALLALAACKNEAPVQSANTGTAAGAGAPAVAPPAAGTGVAAGSGGTGATAQAGAAPGGAPSLPAAGSKAVPADPSHDDAGVPPREDPVMPDPEPVAKGDWVAGDYPKDLMMPNWLEITGLPKQGGGPRQYKVHVPPGYDPKKPTPVVFCIHGLGQDALLFCVSGSAMVKKSDAAGFILVMPNGYQNSWNAGTCCGGAVAEGIDDVAFFRAMFSEVSKHLNVDEKRVYATGLSNGGYMSYRLGCEASDIFAAVAPGAGAIGMDDIGGGTSADGDFEACKPAQKVSVLDIHGTADGLVAYAHQKPSLERIAMQNGCMVSTSPAKQPASQGDTTCVSYAGCPSGVDVTGCTVQGGGHVWFGSPNCGTGVDAACAIVGANSTAINNTDAVWDFLSAHPRP